MNLGFIRQNFACIETGFTDERVAAELERLREVAAARGKNLDLSFFVTGLRQSGLRGEHEWGQIIGILSLSATLFGQNYSMAICYCMQRQRGCLPATFVPPVFIHDQPA